MNTSSNKDQNIATTQQQIHNLISIRAQMLKSDNIDLSLNKELYHYINNSKQEETVAYIEKTLQKCIANMEQIYAGICKLNNENNSKSVNEQINFILEKRMDKEYDDKTLLLLLSKKHNLKVELPNKKRNVKSNKEKIISYEIREELEGFMGKCGSYEWNDDRIDDLINSLFK